MQRMTRQRGTAPLVQEEPTTSGTSGRALPSCKTCYTSTSKNTGSDSRPTLPIDSWKELEGEMWRGVPLSEYPPTTFAKDDAAAKRDVPSEQGVLRQHLPTPAPLPLLSPSHKPEPATRAAFCEGSSLSDVPTKEEIEEVDCTRRCSAEQCSTSASSLETDDQWDPSSSGRGRKANNGGSWTVQGIIGAARTLCRWLYGLRRAISLAAAGASAELVLCSSSCTTASSFLLSLLRRSPLLLSTLMPMMSYLSSGPTSESALLCSTAVVLLTVTPCVSRGSSALHHLLEAGAHAVHSTVSCCSRFLDVNSKSLQSSAHMVSMLAASLRKPRAPSSVPGGSHLNLLAAVDLGLTTAAFLHMMISSSVRWCRGSPATEVLDEMPDDVQELGYMAKIMYDRELPNVVIFGGRRLCLLRNMTDSVMAVYASEDLLSSSQQQQQGHVVVCHRGTWSPRDLIDDAHLLWGTFRSSPRYVDARARKQTLLDLWPGAKYTHVGHSLGGTVAMALVERMGNSVDVEAHAFNPGVSFEGFSSPRSTIHLIAKDPVTFFAAAHPCSDCRIYPAHSHVRYMPLWAHQHSVYNFAPPPPEQPRIKGAASEVASVSA